MPSIPMPIPADAAGHGRGRDEFDAGWMCLAGVQKRLHCRPA